MSSSVTPIVQLTRAKRSAAMMATIAEHLQAPAIITMARTDNRNQPRSRAHALAQGQHREARAWPK
jgi:dihydropteroate synthase